METALAKVYKYDANALHVGESYYEEGKCQENIDAVWETLLKARAKMQELYSHLSLEDETQAEIFEAHLRILEDEELLARVLEAIEVDGVTAEYAFEKVFDEYICMFGESEDAILTDKVYDLRDMKEYLLRILRGDSKLELTDIREEVILVAKELLPSDVLRVDPAYVKGIIIEKGSEWSHAVILAKARQIPIQIAKAGIWNKVENGDLLPVPPSTPVECCDAEVVLEDGQHIEIGINIDYPNWNLPNDCYDFVGLYRTEIQYIAKQQQPTEEELFEAYRDTLIRAGGKCVTFRTMDIGGDKIPQYFLDRVDAEDMNGGIDFCFKNLDIFQTQLRAILRASAYGKVQIMFPMVKSMEDFFHAKELVLETMIQLGKGGQNYDKNIKLGIMIETLPIIEELEQVAKEVDFASIGTNDLMGGLSGIERSEITVNHYDTAFFNKLFA